jgi:hypothetical protein
MKGSGAVGTSAWSMTGGDIDLTTVVVANQFQESWRHPTACPTVRAIYLIVSQQQMLDKYKAHRYASQVVICSSDNCSCFLVMPRKLGEIL